MKKAISFKLSGKTACFRKPDVNQYAYFTYNNIHKIAILGLLGAIVGYSGYTQLFEKNRGLKKGQLGYDDGYPEFYEKLKHLKVSITPLAQNGYFSKKIQVFNNSVGYANGMVSGKSEKAIKERADTYILNVREQWLENPSWQIMILDDDSDEYSKLKEYLLEKKSVFIPYLGKNDHPAKVSEAKEIELKEKLYVIDGEIYIDSLFITPKSGFGFHKESDDMPFMFKEVSPIKLQNEYHFYEYEELVFTNFEPNELPKDTYCYEDKNYSFI